MSVADDENTSEKSKRKEAFKNFRQDYKAAKNAKVKGIDKNISAWNDMYYGKAKKVSAHKSALVMKEIAKQIEMQKPNITEPFLSTSHPIRILGKEKKHMERYLNTHFTSTFNRVDFIEQMTDVKLREGTVWVRSGWESKHSTEELSLTMEQIMMDEREPLTIKPAEMEGFFDVTYKLIVANHGTARVCRNEHCFPDPAAKTKDEMRFFCEKRLKTLSDLTESGFYSKESLKELEEKIDSTSPNRHQGSDLESTRNADNEEYGQDLDYQTTDKARKKISIIEYWGVYDLNGDGIAEPILASWAEHEEIDLELIDNPLPRKNIPYDNDVYSPRPFSLWGNALAYFIGDYQKVKSGMFRGIMDNMALANNGQKFIVKGGIDAINFKRMRNGESTVMLNKANMMEDGSYNSLPQSFFTTLQMVTQESENMSGTGSNGPALSSSMLPKDGSNSQQMTMPQQKMASIVRGSSGLLSKVCRNWITMAEVFLEPEQIEQIFTEEEQINFQVFKDSDKAAISIKVGTDVNRVVKMQQLNMLLQQSRTLEGQLDPATIPELVAEMFELFDKYDDAQKIRTFEPPPPSPEQQAMQQMAMQEQQLKNELLQTQITKEQALTQKAMMDGQKGLIDAQAGSKYKDAQTDEKTAKAESHRVSNATKPAQVIADIASKQAQSRDSQERATANRRSI